MHLRGILAFIATFLPASLSIAAPPQGYSAKLSVSEPTRLDWTFVASNQSVPKPPTEWLGEGYDSKKVTYELFVPPRKDMKQPLPAILFISASAEPIGWKYFEPICKQMGMVFIGVRGAGNEILIPKRARIVLDAFDDVRRQIPLDPDRTYVSGLSGGGRMACGIGFALPEYFGGIIPVVAGGELRDESWLRHRASDRLSVAPITGQTDFNRGEVERWRAPFWKGIGIRTKVWVVPNMGHTMPSATVLAEVWQWVEEGKTKRAELAKQYPATRSSADGVLSREDAAKALLDEGKEKLKKAETLYAGLMLLKGCMTRWPDLEHGQAAKKLLLEYEAKKDRPWEAEDIAEQRRFLIAEARSLGDYLLNGIPAQSQYAKQRPQMAKRVISLWEAIIQDDPDSSAAKEAKKLIPELKKVAEKK